MMTDALMRSRDGTVLQNCAPLATPAYLHGVIGDTASMHRWEPILRFNVALFDLLSGLNFVSNSVPQESQKGSAVLYIGDSPLITMHRPDQAFFRSQFELVKSYAEIRSDRASEIVAQMQPQVPFWSAAIHLHPSHTAKTLELVELALGFASIICMRFKQAMAVPRPIDWSPDIQPIIATPSHSAYPSGHATEAYMIAYTLPALITPDPQTRAAYQTQLLAQAHRIAENRTVAGVHFPVDSYAGQVLAKALADYFLAQCGHSAVVCPQVVNPDNAQMDFEPSLTLFNTANAIANANVNAQSQTNSLVWIAGKAAGEWK